MELFVYSLVLRVKLGICVFQLYVLKFGCYLSLGYFFLLSQHFVYLAFVFLDSDAVGMISCSLNELSGTLFLDQFNIVLSGVC